MGRGWTKLCPFICLFPKKGREVDSLQVQGFLQVQASMPHVAWNQHAPMRLLDSLAVSGVLVAVEDNCDSKAQYPWEGLDEMAFQPSHVVGRAGHLCPGILDKRNGCSCTCPRRRECGVFCLRVKFIKCGLIFYKELWKLDIQVHLRCWVDADVVFDDVEDVSGRASGNSADSR